MKRMTWADREKWLIKFAVTDYGKDEPSDYEKNALQYEAWDFGFRERSQPLPHGGTLTRTSSSGATKCTWDEVLESNRRAHQAIHALAATNPTPQWCITAKLFVEAMGSGGEITQVIHSSIDAFTQEMCIVLARIGSKIRRCPATKPIPFALANKPKAHPHEICGKLFLRTRKDKAYCDEKCRVREAMKRVRAKKWD